MPVRCIASRIAAAILLCCAPPLLAAEVSVQRWQPQDFAFTSGQQPGNPFAVTFSADVSGPGGIKLNMPGFYDGHGTWKVRVSPTAEGAWSLVTHSSAADLDNKTAAFACVANPSAAIHGGLQVDAKLPHQFVWEDGARYFPMGYECDWLWALDSGDPQLKTLNPFLDKLERSGFNFIILNAYAHDTTWCKGRTGEDDFGPPPLFAWEGTNEKPDHSKFNLPYWQHYDGVIEAMYRRGIVAHILMKVYNKQVNWPAKGSAEDDLYFRWLIARYAAYPNVHWDLAKEANNEKNMEYKIDRLRFIRATDPYHRLLTVHDDHATYDKGAYEELLDYRSDQQHSKWRETMTAHLRQHEWPVINTEFGYEQGPGGAGDKTYNVAQPAEEVARRAWEVCMAGGFGAYYYTYTAWDVIRPGDTPPGYAYFKNLREFFETTGYWRMHPAEGVASEGYCLADPGHEYIVFLNSAGPFSLKLEGLADGLKGQWYQALTGKHQDAGTINSATSEMKPPAEWGAGPVALHIGNTTR